jgi:8-oxo-dGTP pyrophosphatase MutT (NUDIX family)
VTASLDPSYLRLHADATLLLEAWAPPSPEQDRRREAFLDHLAAHPDAMARQGPPAHFTASCLVLDQGLQRVLLTLHRKANAWFQFGGHYEPADAGVHAAATREAREESGIAGLVVHPALVELDRHELTGSFGRCREHLDLRFVAVVGDDARPEVSEESLDVAWWPVDGLPADSSTDLPRLIGTARETLASVG